MKKLWIAIMFVLLTANNSFVSTGEKDELQVIADIVEESELEIESWEVTLKENMSRERLTAIINQLKDSYFVTSNEDENSIKYTLVEREGSNELIKTFQAIFPKNNSFTAELTLVLKANEWNEIVLQSYVTDLQYYSHSYFTYEVRKFACLTTKQSAIMSSNDLLHDLTKSLKLQHIETYYDKLQEDIQTEMIYAFSPIWNQQITIQEKPLNIQILKQTTETKGVQWMIGTPILINEY